MAKYLVICEDNLSQYSTLSRDDKEAIDTGDLIVIIWEDDKFYRINSDGKKYEIEGEKCDE
jgi:hypothetical protein